MSTLILVTFCKDLRPWTGEIAGKGKNEGKRSSTQKKLTLLKGLRKGKGKGAHWNFHAKAKGKGNNFSDFSEKGRGTSVPGQNWFRIKLEYFSSGQR